MDDLHRKLDTQDYDTLLLSLYTIYDHVVLETSWAAWAGAITAIDYLVCHSDETYELRKTIEPSITAQLVSGQQEIMRQPVIQRQNEGNVNCVLEELRIHYQIQRCLGKKEHNENLAKVLLFMVELDMYNCRWSNGYRRVREFMELEGGGRGASRYSRHDDFHGGVRYICYPSTCRHTADAYDLIRVLKEICRNLISEGKKAEACEAISVFGGMPRYYKHIAAERLERVRSMWHDKWPGDPPRALTPRWERLEMASSATAREIGDADI